MCIRAYVRESVLVDCEENEGSGMNAPELPSAVVDWKLGKRRLLPSDVTDFVTVEVNGATPKEVRLLHHHLLRHPQVKACSMDASIHRWEPPHKIDMNCVAGVN